ADTDTLEVGRRLRGGDGVPRLLDDGVDAGVTHELPALGFGGLGELRERRRIHHRQLRQHLAIQMDSGLLERGDEPRVRQPRRPAGGVDPDDPEAPRLALFLLAAAVRESSRAQDGLGGWPVQLAASAEIPFRLFEDLLAPTACLGAALGPWHASLLICALQAVAGLGPPPAEARLGIIDTARAPAAGPRPPCRSSSPRGASDAAADPFSRACAASSRPRASTSRSRSA